MGLQRFRHDSGTEQQPLLSETSPQRNKRRMLSYLGTRHENTKLIDTNNRLVVARAEGGGWEKWVNVVCLNKFNK